MTIRYLIAIQHLKENYIKQLKDDYEMVHDCVEYAIVAVKSQETFKYFSGFHDFDFGGYITVVIHLKGTNKKFIFDGQYLCKNLGVLDDLEDFKQQHKEVWDKIYDYYFGTEKKRLKAVMRDPYCVGRIDNPSEAVQLATVERNFMAIGNIEQPFLSVRLAAIRKSEKAYLYIPTCRSGNETVLKLHKELWG